MANIFHKGCVSLLDKCIWRILMLIVLVFIVCNYKYAIAGNTQTDIPTQYPDSPMGVVKAFIKTDFSELIKNSSINNNARAVYISNEIGAIKATNWYDIVKNYSATVLSQGHNEAYIKVKFNIVGEVCSCKKLRLESYDDSITYKLNKIKGLWKLVSPDLTPHISVKSAINLLKQQNDSIKHITTKSINDSRDKINVDRYICLLNKIDSENKSNELIQADCGDPYGRELFTYPSTPEAVVEAMLKTDFDGTTNELIGDNEKRKKYMAENIIAPGSDSLVIISNYKIGKLLQHITEASIEVHYYEVGNLNFDVPLKRLNKESIVIFNLELQNGFWVITSPFVEPRISIATAVNILEHELGEQYLNVPNNSKVMARKITIQTNLDLLKRMALNLEYKNE
jgi:hypothetical protein